MIKMLTKLLSVIGVFLTVMVLAYITHLIASKLPTSYESSILFIGGGTTAVIGATLVSNIFQEK